MRRISLQAAFLGLAAGMASAQVHGGYTLTSVSFANNIFTSSNSSRPLVGDMEFLPDGRVVVAEWGVPSSLFILSGFPSLTGVQVKRFAKGLDNVMGIEVVGNDIYVMEREGLTKLVDKDGDGVADEYNNVNQAFPSDNSMLNLPYDIEYLDGSFYAGLSSDVHTGGYDWGASQWPGTQALAGRSTMYKLNPDGTSSTVACGFRNPNGMDINGDDIFVSENQGSWTPSSKVIHVRQGKFYGHRTNPANACQTSNNNTETPPVVWANWDNNEVGRSWGNPLVLRYGRFAGQILVPDLVVNHANPVVRVFVEEVGGELQGVILPFIKTGTLTGVHRLKQAANGDIYMGDLGSNCCWGARSGMAGGFQVLRDNNGAVFEIKAVRSMGSGSFEIEFTEPVSNAGSYTVTKWRQVAAEEYGGGNNTGNTALTSSAAISATDNKRVTLTVGNLTTGWVVKIVPSGVTAVSGRSLFTQFAVYTLNKFGPGTDYKPEVPTGAVDRPRNAEAGWKLVSGNGSHVLRFNGDLSAPRDIAVYDLRGTRRLELRGETGAESRLNTAGLPKGMYMVRVTEARNTSSGALMIP